jgi:cystathionine gamma-lyase/cystathionine gamma-lyase/homocysteine desulfhydrase
LKTTTQALHKKVDTSNAFPAVTPLYQNSAFEAQSEFFYSRKNNPNVQELEDAICVLEETTYSIATTTGMSAITLALSLLKPGQTIVLNQFTYGCTYKLFQWYASHYGLELIVINLSDRLKEVTRADFVFFETPTNPFLYSIDIQLISDAYKELNPNCLVVVDNTWATPLYQHPCSLGADISLHSATKYISGHSDVMGGIVLTNDAEVAEKLKSQRFYTGANLDAHSAWLLRRSLHTLDVRLEKQGKTTKRIAEFLETRSEIKKVYYPEVDGDQLKDYATLLFFDIQDNNVAKYGAFCDSLNLFSTGTGMACVTSMVAQPYTGSHASMENCEKEDMGLTPCTIRLSFGLEDAEDLIEDLKKSFTVFD